MAKKRNRPRRDPSSASAAPATRSPRRRRFRITPSVVFIAIILLFAVVVGVSSMMGGDAPVDCPPGQVWSDAHAHCH